MRRVVLSLLGLLAVLALAVAPGANAQSSNEAAETCRQLDESGFLADEGGLTRGECVNILTGPASENANNFIAGACGLDYVQELLGVSNKGQCIQVVGDELEP